MVECRRISDSHRGECTVSWDMETNDLVAEYQYFGRTYCFHLQGRGFSSTELLGISSENILIKEDSVTPIIFDEDDKSNSSILFTKRYTEILIFSQMYAG
jgi:hypothetical protein